MTRILPVAAFALLLGCGQVTAQSDGGTDGSSSSDDGGGGGGDASPVCGVCAPQASCVGTTCECNAGWVGDGESCTDLNECITGQNDCLAEAMCINLPGSFSCNCPAGAVGDGRSSCQSGLIYFANDGTNGGYMKSLDLNTLNFTDEVRNGQFSAGYYYPGLFAVGGGLFYFSNDGKRYDGSAWATAAYPAAQQRGEYGGAVMNGRIYAIGGRGPRKDGAYYDPASNSWTPIADYPWPVEWPAAGAVGGKLYVVGGRADVGGNTVTNKFAVYDPANNTWTPLADAPFSDGAPYGAVAGNSFWALAQGAVWRYTPGGQWANSSSLPSGTNFKPVVVDDVLYLVGDNAAGTAVIFMKQSAVAPWVTVASLDGFQMGFWSHAGPAN